MGLQFDASPEEIKLFLEEADEHLQLLEEDLVRLEKEDDTADLLQAIFRSAHTLKGSSATLGHQRMAQLTHAMENILDKLRKDQVTLTTGVMDVLFEALDLLRVLKEEIVTLEESDVDLTGMLEGLAAVANQEVVKPEVKVEKEEYKMELDSHEKQVLREAGEERNAFLINISLQENSEMLPVRALITMMTMRELGEIVKSQPSMEDIEREIVSTKMQVLLLTDKPVDFLNNSINDLPDIVEFHIDSYQGGESVPEEIEVQPSVLAQEAKIEEVKVQNGSNNKAAAKDIKINKQNRTVRVDVELLDNLMNLVGELVIDRTRLAQVLGTLEARYEDTDLTEDLNRTSIHIGRVTTQLQEEIMKARMLPVESLFNKFPRMMRDLSQKAGKEVDFQMEGQETELDRSIIEEIGDPLIHLLRNSVDHAIETPEERKAMGKNPVGMIKLGAHHEENHINIVVRDDGRGIDPEKIRASAVKKGLIAEDVAHRLGDQEAINLIFASGLSTASKVSDISGRGVGMDVVRTNLEKVNGAIEIHTEVGKGTEIKIKLPLTLAIIRALLVNLSQRVYAIPLTSVLETIRITNDQIKIINKREAIVVRGNVLPLLRLRELFNTPGVAEGENDKIFVVVVNMAGQQLGIVVDALVGEQEVVIKSLGKFIGDVQGIAGATILGDGSVALIIDVPSLMKKFTAMAS
ncbi:MAG: chemotaxis protein CheA [Clostridia bacterium]|nr:chemotaxis protein CheA [Clostridia bacterium]